MAACRQGVDVAVGMHWSASRELGNNSPADMEPGSCRAVPVVDYVDCMVGYHVGGHRVGCHIDMLVWGTMNYQGRES